MLKATLTIQHMPDRGDGQSWTYLLITGKQFAKFKPVSRRSFRVKGTIDDVEIKQKSFLPVRDGGFLLALNAEIRKSLCKRPGDKVKVALELDKSEFKISRDLIACLKDDPQAYEQFNRLNKSSQRFFSEWITSAKTSQTKAERIATAVTALHNGKNWAWVHTQKHL